MRVTTAGQKPRPPLVVVLPVLLVLGGTCLPVIYLLMRAFAAEPEQIAQIVLRERNLLLLANTLKLVALVLGLGTLIALPMAWLVTRSDLGHRRLVSFLMVLPLAVPGYVMAYAIIGLSGYYGFLKHWFGLSLPPLRGLWGAGLALTLYTFPYIFLNLRAAFLGMDPALEETARSLGRSRTSVFRQVVLPQLWPALVSGWLVVGLYVIGDFGAVALIRYEVFSYAIYTQYSGAFDRTYAAWLALILLAMTVAALFAQGRLTRNRRFAATGSGARRLAQPIALGAWRWPARLCVCGVALAALGLPLMVLLHWMRLGLPSLNAADLGAAMTATVLIAGPAALVAMALALPVVLLDLRWPGPLSRLAERLAWLGYATPALALALSLAFLTLQVAPVLYQTHALLIFAYVISFIALAFGPIRLALMQIGPHQEEAARALGASPLRAFASVVMPRLRRPMIAAGILVFVMVVKDLPIAWMLAPTGTRTLATTIFARTGEGMMAEAAPFALVLILFSAVFVGLILKYEGGGRGARK
ncbi:MULTISPECIES: ABC transporter permease [unclassified Haematobacter]|uniref:ABC transporter permease n=1 Tax=unclassified Haematobacter TaxID=2640585 RepID=UPI0025C03E67|nr:MULTISPECIES: iron ABC transporter permease [unclassified Haematobacter]